MTTGNRHHNLYQINQHNVGKEGHKQLQVSQTKAEGYSTRRAGGHKGQYRLNTKAWTPKRAGKADQYTLEESSNGCALRTIFMTIRPYLSGIGHKGPHPYAVSECWSSLACGATGGHKGPYPTSTPPPPLRGILSFWPYISLW
jgi:hypothetical protein